MVEINSKEQQSELFNHIVKRESLYTDLEDAPKDVPVGSDILMYDLQSIGGTDEEDSVLHKEFGNHTGT